MNTNFANEAAALLETMPLETVPLETVPLETVPPKAKLRKVTPRTSVACGAYTALVAMLLFTIGCAPGLHSSLAVTRFPALAEQDGDRGSIGGVRVHIGPFEDLRQNKEIGEIDGRRVMPEGNVAEAARRAAQFHFAQHGWDPVLFRAPVIEGKVTRWYVTVEPEFPSSLVTAKAQVRFLVYNADEQVTYRVTYSGTVAKRHPFLDEVAIEETLASAMSEALIEAATDSRLKAEVEETIDGASSQ